MKFSTHFIAFFVLFTTLFGSNAHALTPAEIRNEIQTQINQRHPNTPDQFWTNLGTAAVPVIRQMYKETTDVHERTWLIEGMGHFDDSENTSFLKSQISSTGDEIMKKGMLSALIQSQGDEAYEFVEPYLKDQDPHVRTAVAVGLRDRVNSDRARKRLEEFNRQEKLAWVKEALKKKPPTDQLQVSKVGEDERAKVEAPKPSPTPMPEKSWAGEWNAAYITSKKNASAKLTLVLVNEKPKKDEVKWKIEFKLPKQAKQELREKDVEIVYYQSATLHWIEIRNQKNDSVLIGHRK